VHFGLGQLEYRPSFDRAVAHFAKEAATIQARPRSAIQYAESCAPRPAGPEDAQILGACHPRWLVPPLPAGVAAGQGGSVCAAAAVRLAKGEGTDSYDTGFNLAWRNSGGVPHSGGRGRTRLIAQGRATTEPLHPSGKPTKLLGRQGGLRVAPCGDELDRATRLRTST